MADEQQERTEEATQQRREDFRKRGQVAQTKELASVLVLLGTAGFMWTGSQFVVQQSREILRVPFGDFLVTAARSGDLLPASVFVVQKGLLIGGPVLAMLLVLSLAATLLQVGVVNNEEALEANVDRINPVEGFKRIFSLRSLVEGLKSVLKLLLVSGVAYLILKSEFGRIPNLSAWSIEGIAHFLFDISVRLIAGVGLLMLVIAAADYLYQWWDLEKQMRMSKQEIKEEHKSREGDPLIKARIRRIQREMASKRMMTEVPKADVVITNPTHIACALRYDPATMAAPQLIAKGAGTTAERIKEIAREKNIPVIENKPLARTIFKTLKIGQVIPRELFTAVAQVLSYVYKLRRKAVRT
jgi:flagellar biosynthetic protein FlhB